MLFRVLYLRLQLVLHLPSLKLNFVFHILKLHVQLSIFLYCLSQKITDTLDVFFQLDNGLRVSLLLSYMLLHLSINLLQVLSELRLQLVLLQNAFFLKLVEFVSELLFLLCELLSELQLRLIVPLVPRVFQHVVRIFQGHNLIV